MRQATIDISLITRILSGLTDTRTTRSDVVVMGSMNADHTVEVETMPHPGETILAGPMVIHPGGKSANQASSCAHLGQRTHLLGAVGSDANADMLIHELNGAGVDTEHIERVAGPSGSTIIVVDAHGENFVVVSAGSNGTVTPEYVRRRRRVIESSAVLGLCLESPFNTVLEAARIAAAADTQVVLNISPMPSDDNMNDLVPLIELADVAIMNEHETSRLLGMDAVIGLDDDWESIGFKLHELGLKKVIVTLGEFGSVVLDDEQTATHIPAVTVRPVDTTGAGDSFMGSVLAGLAHGNSLENSCTLAAVVSAYSTRGKGAQSSYGDADEILDFLSMK